MKVTIVGTGNGASAMAADLNLKGHNITMLKSSTSTLHNSHFDYLKKNSGKIILRENGVSKEAYIDKITTDYSEAITDETDIVIIFIQTNYHRDVINKLSPFLKEGQIVLMEPGYMSSLYFFENKRHDINIVEAESSPIDCRIVEDGVVDVLFRNVRNPVAIESQGNKDEVTRLLAELDYNFIIEKSIVEAALHNPNIIVHTIGAVMSIPRIEYTDGNYWMYREVFTPSVWNIVESLDNEKKMILKKLGLEGISYVDKCLFRNSKDLELDSKEVFLDYAFNSSPKGPEVSDSRYITEDVSQGLVMMEKIADILSIHTPVTTSLIDLSSSALNIDFRKNGRTFDEGLLEKFIEPLIIEI